MIWFTADLHFGCDKLVANTRPEFGDVEEHDIALINNINRRVDRNDRLIILGDFCREKPGRYRPGIRCRHLRFIMGNHDKPSKSEAVFGRVEKYATIKLSTGDKAVCCHYCMNAWDRSHYGAYHFYGHWHAKYEDMMDRMFPERRSMDVGVDNAKLILDEYRPFSEVELLDLLSGRKGHDFIPLDERWTTRDYS